ncbi:hypothetical protein CTEN210_10462 [Chaetoceros tenuissimus]|uniref:Ubiquitin carboxyl-terminal hydrolase n=1 Tax=Chaetoceros tenuissimus TaxID=426638 RepID=A0AAD3H8D4_9STRA|nr:hypothetical protein CTEN210_10462 [Chaetoceros tenuissimus]
MGCMAEKIDWLYEECDGFTGSREEIFGFYRDQCIERGEMEKSDEVDYNINQMKYEKAGVFVCKDMYLDESRNVYVIEFFDAKYELSRNGTWISYIRGILRKVCALMEFLPHFIIIPLHPVRDPGVVFLKTKKGKIVSFKSKIACAGYTWLCDAKPMLWGYDDNGNFVCFGEWDRSNDELVLSSEFDLHSDFEIEEDDSYTIELDEMDEFDYEEENTQILQMSIENKDEVEEHDEMEEDIPTLQTGNLPLSPIHTPIPQCNLRQGIVAKGLQNLGNTCYLNASLQVLFSLPDFLQDLDKLCSDIKSRSMDASAESSIPICSAMLSIGKDLGLISYLPGIESTTFADPSILRNEIEKKLPDFRVGQQQDAEEFMSCLIAILHEELKDATQNIGIDEKSLPTSTFFQIVIQLSRKCDSCGSSRSSHETFTRLALEVHDHDMSDNEWSVSKGLNKYFSDEKIEHFQCDECSNKTSCTMCKTMVSRPKAIVVQLKRFAYNNNQMQKRSEKVAPTREISLEKFVDENLVEGTRSLFTYGLTGVVSHLGRTPDSGHYTATALRRSMNSEERVWMKFNDSETATSSFEDVNSEPSQRSNYLLLYCTKLDDLSQV